ncbi:DoxX family protein [Arachidicoccus terrestris]|uniref:DoxX family protein n=1 Tax=Arachidicoccus terrestris TaxID=2875539 RepID=UPI001CC3F49A|nr:DoxX family protein [Arachidicoccus terrestris]UAY56594.1 DoxX family protein [Arachidicoccus terrestris]
METVVRNNKKSTKITYWVTTLIIALFELSGAFFINSEIAKAGTRHLMLPEWFRWEVSIGHIIGGILLIVPVSKRIKEWTYVAFGIDFISAFIAYAAVDGWTASLFSPLLFMALLVVSYITYHKLHDNNGFPIVISPKTGNT